MTQRIGLFGGTFDPVHQGHLNALLLLQQAVDFERVHWVLSARPPHKDQISATIEHRYEMLQLALRDHSYFEADDTEIKRQRKSYTYDTVLAFKQRYPQSTLYLIIGGDSLHQLHTWHRYQELIAMVHIIVMNRPGYPLDVPSSLADRTVTSIEAAQQSDAGKLILFDSSDFDISSTALRQALGQDNQDKPLIQAYLSPQVYDYIQQHHLYEKPRMNSEQLKDKLVDALENIKGQDINVIHIADISDFADYMVVASGTSDTHVRALAREASDQLRKQGVKPINEDGADIGEWVLVDFGDVVLHVMRPEVREYYDLEKLWDEDVRNMMKEHREQST